jgi:hypothetical protein
MLLFVSCSRPILVWHGSFAKVLRMPIELGSSLVVLALAISAVSYFAIALLPVAFALYFVQDTTSVLADS